MAYKSSFAEHIVEDSAMNATLRRRINELANDILRLYGISIPIYDMRKVVDLMGGEVLEDVTLGAYSDGKVMKNKDSFSIFIPPNQPIVRENFTIAHELGHLFLHMGYLINKELWENSDATVYNRKGSSETEMQANEFAAAFLMPQQEYKEIVDLNTEDNMVNISNVASHFNVSTEAASYRGKWLGYLQW